jgi:hypothetical protein
MQERYEVFKDSIAKVRERGGTANDNRRITARDHPSVVEVSLFF